MMIAQLEQPNGSMSSPIQADPAAVIRNLFPMLPAFLTLCVAAAAAPFLRPSPPVTQGLTVGGGCWLALSSIAGLLYQQQQPAWLTLLLVPVGAAATVFAWNAASSSFSEVGWWSPPLWPVAALLCSAGACTSSRTLP